MTIKEYSDEAILGFVNGSRSQRTIEGPFESYEDAMDVKCRYRRNGCIYYGIRKSDTRPSDTNISYDMSRDNWLSDSAR